jgi:hypothetical protein
MTRSREKAAAPSETDGVEGDDSEAWSAQMSGLRPRWLVADLRRTYGFFPRDGLVAGPEQLEQMRPVLGRDLRTYASFVSETAVDWSD